MTRFTTTFDSRTFRVAGAVAALAVAAPLTVPARAAEKIQEIPCNRDRTVEGATSDWQQFPAPQFEAGLGVAGVSQEIKAYAVDPSDTSRVIITNGNSVYTSRDGGCGWTLGLKLDQVPSDPSRVPLSGLITTIKFVYIAPGGTYFAVAEELETGATVGRPHVLRSETGRAASWQVADEGLPPIGTPLAMRASKTGNTVYLTFSGAREESTECPPAPLPCGGGGEGDPLGLIYASTNRGASWQARSDPNDLNSATSIKYLSVDDDTANGDHIWVVANGLLRESRNGGRGFEVPDGLEQAGFQFTAVESLRQGRESGGLSVVAFGRGKDGPGMIRLQRGRWMTSALPFHAEVDSVAQRSTGDIAVSTTSAAGMPQIWRAFPQFLIDRESDLLFTTTEGWQSITPARAQDSPVPAGLASGNAPAGADTFYLRERKAILRFLGSSLFTDPVIAPGGDIVPPPPPRGRITPATLDLDLGVNKTKTVDYTLTLPPSPTPLDVYLLVDNSGSMVPFITELKENLRRIALALNESGVNVGIGVGAINVQPNKEQLPIDNPTTPTVDESKPRPIYERLRPIGPVNRQLFDQLSLLAGTAGPGSEPQLEALYQAVTGAGLQYTVPFNYLGAYSVRAGEGAEFRDPLMPIKVIVHATDENFTGTPDENGEDEERIRGENAHNEIAPVAEVLKQANVKQIGLSMDQPSAEDDLKEMARLTGALAPRGGTDCDGDGVIGEDDVRAGQPLVCGQSDGLDTTLVNLLKALSDPQTITLSKRASPTMVAVSQEEFRINAKQSTKVRFSVTYTCKGLAPGQYTNDLTAALRGDLIAKAVATVTCGGLAVPAKPQAEVLDEPASNPPPVQPQPIVPAPVPVNPVPQPQTQVQTQTQVNPQAGMADQEEQQFQLASATNDLRDENQPAADQLSMSRLSHEDAALGVLGVGMVMAAGFGVGMATRRRTRTAPAKVRARF